MIFGGLELVAGGYLVHRHYKHKNEKKRQAAEVEARRHHTFPGAHPASPHHQPHRPPPYQQPATPQQKFACHAARPQPHYQNSYPAQHTYPAHHHPQPRPAGPVHAQTFSIPRRPVPQRDTQVKPQIIIQPSLQRTDSFATLSRMPIADGYRPYDTPDTTRVLPPRQVTAGLQPALQHGVYGNAGFSVSTPALGATPTSPSLTYTMGSEANGRQTVDDNWETYQHPNNSPPHYAPTVSTELGEREAPPPYTP